MLCSAKAIQNLLSLANLLAVRSLAQPCPQSKGRARCKPGGRGEAGARGGAHKACGRAGGAGGTSGARGTRRAEGTRKACEPYKNLHGCPVKGQKSIYALPRSPKPCIARTPSGPQRGLLRATLSAGHPGARSNHTVTASNDFGVGHLVDHLLEVRARNYPPESCQS